MSTPFLAEVKLVSFNFAPKGWVACNGQTLAINQYQAVFSLIGTYTVMNASLGSFPLFLAPTGPDTDPNRYTAFFSLLEE